MHTDPTLDILSQVTRSLGSRLRAFQEKTCAVFQTRELERERLARQRRTERSATGTTPGSSKPMAPSKSSRKLRQLNLRTYKYHSLGDYFNTIRRLGTTDSYSTQSVSSHLMPHLLFLNVGGEHQSELEHRTSKARFLRTSGQLIPQQLSRIERRQRHITTIRENLRHPLHSSPSQAAAEDVVDDPGEQYNMGKSQKFPVHIPTLLQKNEGDPAVKVNSFALLHLYLLTRPLEFFPKAEGASASTYPNGASPRS
jgi:hypothetical protein